MPITKKETAMMIKTLSNGKQIRLTNTDHASLLKRFNPINFKQTSKNDKALGYYANKRTCVLCSKYFGIESPRWGEIIHPCRKCPLFGAIEFETYDNVKMAPCIKILNCIGGEADLDYLATEVLAIFRNLIAYTKERANEADQYLLAIYEWLKGFEKERRNV